MEELSHICLQIFRCALFDAYDVTVSVKNAEKRGEHYIVPINRKAPQAKIMVTGYGKTNTYELYI